jgi:hypothetical protein
MIRYPIEMLGLLTFSVSFSLAYMVKILEGPLYYVLNSDGNISYNDYRDIGNAMWNVFVTMTTG